MTYSVSYVLMFSKFRHALGQLDLEEKILIAGTLVALIGVLLPWLGGEWFGGERVTYSGLSFFTAFLGFGVVFLHGAILFVTFSPLMGGPSPIHKRSQDTFRFFCALQALILTIAALSVLTKVTFEFSRVEIRFGIYVSLIGSLAASLYGFLKLQEEKRKEARGFFHGLENNAHIPVVHPEGENRQEKVEHIKQDVLREHSVFRDV